MILRVGIFVATTVSVEEVEGSAILRHQRHRALTVGTLERQKTNQPVHTWSLAELSEVIDWRHS